MMTRKSKHALKCCRPLRGLLIFSNMGFLGLTPQALC
jgi:hypothetical protein